MCWYVMIAGYHSLAQHTTTPYHKNDVKKKIVEAVLRFAVEAKPWLLAFSVVSAKRRRRSCSSTKDRCCE